MNDRFGSAHVLARGGYFQRGSDDGDGVLSKAIAGDPVRHCATPHRGGRSVRCPGVDREPRLSAVSARKFVLTIHTATPVQGVCPLPIVQPSAASGMTPTTGR